MKCFLDFDDTLVHRSKMTDDIYAAFEDRSVEDLRRHYDAFRKEHPFTIAGFTQYLTERGIDGGRLRELFIAFAKRADQYVFPDTIAFIERLKTLGHECILVSVDAEPELWQNHKISASGLAPLFDEIHVIQGSKADFLASWNLTDPFVFLDDKQTEVDAMRERFPNSFALKHEVGAPLLPHLEDIANFVQTLQDSMTP